VIRLAHFTVVFYLCITSKTRSYIIMVDLQTDVIPKKIKCESEKSNGIADSFDMWTARYFSILPNTRFNQVLSIN
jgi:hypothetical protein